MKKKTERYSFKRLTNGVKKIQLNGTGNLNDSHEIIPNNFQMRNKSSQRPMLNETHFKFKVTRIGDRNQKLKTEPDQINKKCKKVLTGRIKERDQRLKSKVDCKGRVQMSIPKNVKKLHLNADFINYAKNSSLERSDGYQIAKNSSFRKPYSNRSGPKKTALERYISQSLQNLQCHNQKNKSMISKPQTSGRPYLKKNGDETLQKQKPQRKVFQNTTTKQVKDEKIVSKFQQQKKLKLDKDDSIQKIDLKWQKKRRNQHDLSGEQIQIFGDRFPDGFDKIRLLGRGGFSLVWLGEHKKSKKNYAVKQIITESSHQTHIKQIWFGTYFFQFGGAPKQQFIHHPGIRNLVRLYYYFINKKDTWILYEKCGDSLGNALYQLKSQHYNNDKVYRMHYKELYNSLRKNQKQLKKIVLEVARALDLLAQQNIVHSDIKTQNILVRLKNQNDHNDTNIADVKLIDYGSSFVFSSLRQFSMATPEYMAPEILNFILYENQLEYIPKLFEYVQQYHHPWVIDVWSLGSVLLEIVSGIPLWMSLKTVVRKKSFEMIKYGLFAIKGRPFDKIIRKQIEVVQNLDHFLQQQNYSGIVLDQDLKYLLKKMLHLNPTKRISPAQIVQYLQSKSTIYDQNLLIDKHQ